MDLKKKKKKSGYVRSGAVQSREKLRTLNLQVFKCLHRESLVNKARHLASIVNHLYSFHLSDSAPNTETVADSGRLRGQGRKE